MFGLSDIVAGSKNSVLYKYDHLNWYYSPKNVFKSVVFNFFIVVVFAIIIPFMLANLVTIFKITFKKCTDLHFFF